MKIHHQSDPAVRPAPDPETQALRAFIRAYIADNEDPQARAKLPTNLRAFVERFLPVIKRTTDAR